MKLIFSIINLFLLLIPRFVKETVAIIVYEDETYDVLCMEDELTEDSQYSALATYKAFTFLGEDYFSTCEILPKGGIPPTDNEN